MPHASRLNLTSAQVPLSPSFTPAVPAYCPLLRLSSHISSEWQFLVLIADWIRLRHPPPRAFGIYTLQRTIMSGINIASFIAARSRLGVGQRFGKNVNNRARLFGGTTSVTALRTGRYCLPPPPPPRPRSATAASTGGGGAIISERAVRQASSCSRVRPAARAAGGARWLTTTSDHESSGRDFREDEEMIRETVSKFASDVIAPRVRDMDASSKMDPAVISGLFENGLMGIEAPEKYGGSALNFSSACIVVEEIAKVDPAVAVLVDIHNTLIVNMLRFWGSEELQEKYFARICSRSVSSFCLSEVGSGSDAFSLSTKATPSADGSYYTIEGRRCGFPTLRRPNFFSCSPTSTLQRGYKGITCFVVEKEFGGITVGPKEDKLGIRASSTCPVTFSDCKVPKANVLGEVGQGYKYAIEILNEGRIGIAAQMVGLARGCMEDTLPYLYERKQFGQPVGDFQGMQHQVAQVATEIEAATALYRSAARMKEAGEPFVKEAAMCKLYTSQVAERTASKCVEWLGGVGFTKAFLAEKFYRDCKIGGIYEGTSNIQLSTIAKLMRQDHAP